MLVLHLRQNRLEAWGMNGRKGKGDQPNLIPTAREYQWGGIGFVVAIF